MELLEQQRIDCVRTYSKLLTQVRSKLASGVYTLDRWRRVFDNTNPKKGNGKGEGGKRKKVDGDKKDGATKLSNIVSKILASKTGEDLMMPSDGDSDNSDNYNIYG